MTTQPTHSQKLEWFEREFRPHFDEWVVETARRMVNAGDDIGVAMPAFIWLTCGIDWLAGFWWGTSTRNHVKQAYTGFVKTYFSSVYNAEDLYDSLRNGIVHSFTIKNHRYALKHRQPEMHLRPNAQGFELINLENFFQDWQDAKNKFFDDVEQKPDLLDRVYERYVRDGFLQLVPIDFSEV